MISIFLFDDKEINKKHLPTIANLLIAIIIFSIPKTITIANILLNIAIVSIAIFSIILITYWIATALGSHVKISEYFNRVSFVIMLSSLFVFIFILIFLFAKTDIEKNILLKASATLLTTYYPITLVAYSMASASRLKEIKKLVVGILSLNLYFLYHLLLLMLP